MNRSTFNHGKSGDTNPKGRSRSPLLKLYPRLLRSEREEIIGHRASAACGGRPRLCYTLDEGKETERETTNCPPKRVRSTGVRLIFLTTPWGFPCCVRFPCVHAVATTPAQRLAASSARFPSRISFPRFGIRVSLCIDIFEACSAFTRVTACTLAPSPYFVTASPKASTV